MMLRKRSVTLELRLRAQAESRREARDKLKMIAVRFLVGLAAVVVLVFIAATDVLARESRIEEVHSNQLEKLLNAKDFVAVFWYARSCRLCDEALDELEDIDDDARKFSVDFVKINDKRLAKTYGIKKFPALTFFQNGELAIFDGDISDEDEVLEFLTSESFLVLPDKIETVNAEQLSGIVSQESLVTVLFYDGGRDSAAVINELENIDDEADVFKIRFVKIRDEDLSEEYSLTQLPALVYFRGGIPIVYHGDLGDEVEVLEWLIQHQTSADEQDLVERVGERELDIMIKNVDHLMVLFHDGKKTSQLALEALENVDDDCDKIGVSFVKLDDVRVARKHGVTRLPTLVYFEKEIPSVYESGDITDMDRVLSWLIGLVEGSDIEEVGDKMLEKMVRKEEMVAVLFYRHNDKESKRIVDILEDIDDDLDKIELPLVKSRQTSAAEEYGIDKMPSLVMFQRGIPNLYQGRLDKSAEVLAWLLQEASGQHQTVEVVTDAMLDQLIGTRRLVAAFFYNGEQSTSKQAIEKLEEIDDDLQDRSGIYMVKIDDRDEAEEYGITKLPALVLFKNAVPNIYRGDLLDVRDVLAWASGQVERDLIEDVNAKMLEKLVSQGKRKFVVYVYYEDVAHDEGILAELERIDRDLEADDIHLVKLHDDDTSLADRYGVDVIPALVAFKKEKAVVFEGDVGIVPEAVIWIRSVWTDD